jgi:hypothetical protein
VLKLVVFLAGLIAGSAGTVSWLLSSHAPNAAPPVAGGAVPLPAPPGTPLPPMDDLKARLENLKIRFQEAHAEGERAGQETEQRLRGDLEAYRKNPSHPRSS